MKLAKPHLDIGLFTQHREPQLAFWQQTVGLQFDHIGKLGGGVQQLRHHAHGSIIKVNHARDPLPSEPPSGLVGLRLAQAGLTQVRSLLDPDGNRVALVPPGHEGVTGLAIELVVNERRAHQRFWCDVMQFDSPRPDVYQCGDSLLIVIDERPVARAQEWRASGWRYLTVQVHDCVAEHAGILERGGEEGSAPRLLGDVVRYSFVRDPDGNFIEISQRASLVGALSS
jgi:lactoylglutathione lyase